MFIGFHKAFDIIKLKAKMDALTSCRVYYIFSKFIYNIYKNSKTTFNLRLRQQVHKTRKMSDIGGYLVQLVP